MIEPALNNKQWGYWFKVNPARGPIVRSIAFDFADGAEGVDIPMPLCGLEGVVALCNAALPDDDPRKITRADVKEVQSLAGAVRDAHDDTLRDFFGWMLKPSDVARWRASEVSRLESLAAKLAALLPPEAL